MNLISIDLAEGNQDAVTYLTRLANVVLNRGGVVVVDFSTHRDRVASPDSDCMIVSGSKKRVGLPSYRTCVADSAELVRDLASEAQRHSEYIRFRGFAMRPSEATLLGWNPDELWKPEITEFETAVDWVVAKVVNDFTSLVLGVNSAALDLLSSAGISFRVG